MFIHQTQRASSLYLPLSSSAEIHRALSTARQLQEAGRDERSRNWNAKIVDGVHSQAEGLPFLG
jgi:hypothetical protein